MSNTDTTALATIEVKGSSTPLLAAQLDGRPITALRPIVEGLGMDFSTQHRKLTGKSWATMVIFTTVGADGKPREMVGVDRRTLTMYLATLDEKRVKEEYRPSLIALQAEAADALDAYFSAGVAVSPQSLSTFDILRAQIDQLETAQRTADEAKAIAVRTEARIDAIEGQHDWWSALGYARLNGLNTSTQHLQKFGAHASRIAKAHGVEPAKVPHALFGTVNSYPEWIWKLVSA